MVDYIIVGAGLAGIAFAETALSEGKSILVFDNQSQNSSKIAGGLYNPVILKRFSSLQNAQEQLDVMNEFYKTLEAKLGIKVNHQIPILRKFFSIEEQNNWFIACDKPGISGFLSTSLVSRDINGISSPYGYGEVLQTGYVDTAALLEEYKSFLANNDFLIEAEFKYTDLELLNNSIAYNKITAKHLIFAEGFGMHANPYFNYLPLDGTKGELFIIKASGLALDVIVNTNVFILPLGDDLFKVGATYNWIDKTDQVTEEGKEELIGRIKEILNCDFEIVEHLAGVRPTVKDRKPLLGTHPRHKNIHILNGLGTRGVMLGPYMAKVLFDNIEMGIPISRENDIKRFTRLYQDSYRNS